MRIGFDARDIPSRELSKCQLSSLWCRGPFLAGPFNPAEESDQPHAEMEGFPAGVLLGHPRALAPETPAGLGAPSSRRYLPPHPPAHLLQNLFSSARQTPIHLARFPLGRVVLFPGSFPSCPSGPSVPVPTQGWPRGPSSWPLSSLPLRIVPLHCHCWFSRPDLTSDSWLLHGRGGGSVGL